MGWLDDKLALAGVTRPAERTALIWSFSYFFVLLAGYFILRPLRDEMGVAAGVNVLQWLFTATFVVMLAAAPVYAAALARFERKRLIPLVYHFFVLNLALFWALLYLDVSREWVARVFFVWVSVFNLFAVSVFWSFMADIFRADEGKRLYGFIAAGGTAGTLLGSTIAVTLAEIVQPLNLLAIAALLLEAAVFCVWRLERAAAALHAGGASVPAREESADGPGPMDGGLLAGFRLILSSRYLIAIALWVTILSLAGTFLYFLQRDVVAAASADPAVRTRIFATMDLSASILTLLIQTFLTGKILERMGAGFAAAVLPAVFAIGFVALAFSPVLAVIVIFQALQRTANFGVSNPARELFFTTMSREEKYKAKNVIDTALFRGGDVVWGWGFTALRGLGMNVTAIALTAAPIALAWLGISLWLGREQERRVRALDAMEAETQMEAHHGKFR